MSKVSIKLDQRKKPSVKLMVSVGTTSRMISLGVVLDDNSQWDGLSVIARPDAKGLNQLISQRLLMARTAMIDMERQRGSGGYTCAELVDAINECISPEKAEREQPTNEHSVLNVWREKMEATHGRNWEIYETSLKRLREYVSSYAKDPDHTLSLMSFDMVTRSWVDKWVDYMKNHGCKTNTRSIYLRCLRAVCMHAWKYDHTTAYLFKSYKIAKEDSEVEPLTPEEFKALFQAECDESVKMYRDIALIGFGLIGMNVVDMAQVKWSDVRNGYIHYERAKTHRKYTIKIEPEIMALINKYRGEEHLLSWADRYKDYKSFQQHMNEEGLQRVGPVEWKEVEDSYHTRKVKVWHPVMPNLTYYSLRHTWACFCADLDVPKDIIALCLGHGKKTVTDVYVRYDQKKIDEANRKVLDYAFELINKKG